MEKNEEFLYYVLYLLNFHGFWPKNRKHHFGDVLYLNFLYSAHYLLATLTGMNFILYRKEASITELADIATCLLENTFAIYVFGTYMCQVNKIKALVEELRNFEKFGEPSGLKALIVKQNNYVKLIYVSMYFAAGIGAYVSYIANLKCEKRRKPESHPCSLIIPTWLPFDLLEQYWIKIGMFIGQYLALVSLLLPCVLGTYLGICTIEHITIRLQHLRSLLRTAPEDTVESERLKKLIWCIKYHVDNMRLISRLNDAFSKCYSVHFALSSMLMGMSMFQILMFCSLKDIIHLLGWMISMGALCHEGQQLIDEGEAIATDIYQSKWYEQSKPYKTSLLIFLDQAQETLKVNVGFIYYFSYDYLKLVGQTSFKYMTIAIQLTWLIENKI